MGTTEPCEEAGEGMELLLQQPHGLPFPNPPFRGKPWDWLAPGKVSSQGCSSARPSSWCKLYRGTAGSPGQDTALAEGTLPA